MRRDCLREAVFLFAHLRTSKNGPTRTFRDVRYLVAIRSRADITVTSLNVYIAATFHQRRAISSKVRV